MPAGPLLTLELQGLLFDAKSVRCLFKSRRCTGLSPLHELRFGLEAFFGKTNVGGKLEVPSLAKPLRR